MGSEISTRPSGIDDAERLGEESLTPRKQGQGSTRSASFEGLRGRRRAVGKRMGHRPFRDETPEMSTLSTLAGRFRSRRQPGRSRAGGASVYIVGAGRLARTGARRRGQVGEEPRQPNRRPGALSGAVARPDQDPHPRSAGGRRARRGSGCGALGVFMARAPVRSG